LRSDIERQNVVADDQFGPEYGHDEDPTESPPGDRPPTLSFPLDESEDPNDVQRAPVLPVEPVELPHWTEPATGSVPEKKKWESGARRR